MTLLGFNATAVAAGMTTRGQSRRTGKRPYALMDPQTLAATICKSTAEELEQLFNGTIACLARFGIFADEVTVAVDGTPIPTSPDYAGCGCRKVSRSERNEQGADLRTWESYRPPTQPGKHLRHRQRPAFNAVLVRMWRNHEQQDGPRIYLTNGAPVRHL